MSTTPDADWLLDEKLWLNNLPDRAVLARAGFNKRLGFSPHSVLADDFKVRDKFIKKFSFAVPCKEAVGEIVSRSRLILEVGAGTGFWARLIGSAGADIKATDAAAGNSDYSQPVGAFVTVSNMKAAKAVATFPDRDVLMVWPCYQKSWSLDVIKAMRPGRIIFYIGEWCGCTASDRFHSALKNKSQFEQLVEYFPLPQFWGIHDSLHIFRKLGGA